MPAPITEAERFSAAVLEMPANVRWFFEREEPVPAWRRELEEERAERKRLTALGGWCGG
jgi:hypothetical protein